jgi:hypothetical protein
MQIYLGLAAMNQAMGDADPNFAPRKPLRDPLGLIRVGLKKSWEPASHKPVSSKGDYRTNQTYRTLYDTPNDYFNQLRDIVEGVEALRRAD